ncbi:MAG TPA: histidine--tRNA ligase [Anaerolineales bacterium]|nr:histidine--tRNA ligase [Anaerolineales bacterium]
MPRFQRPTGTLDILPEEQSYWEHVRAHAIRLARRAGFERIDVPVFEATDLFARGIGAATDVVEKEMYTFNDKGGNSLTLRPEFTAGVVRAYIEHGMHVRPQPVKLYSIGPVFRYDRPQAGRYRQFHQLNLEILGTQDPAADLEIMLLVWDLYAGLGFRGLSFQLNSTGCPRCRPAYVELLKSYYHRHVDQICDDCRRRLETNPLRVLDCKAAQCQPVIEAAPPIGDHLCDECADHFAQLREYLDLLGKPYTLNHRLVRGLDYYTKTVFEVWAAGIGAQAAVCGGGRYDGLAEILGGPSTPAVGVAAGLERIILGMKAQEVGVPPLPPPPVFLAHLGPEARQEAARLADGLRRAGIGAWLAFGERGLKSQLREANKRGASYVVLIGEDELAQGVAAVRDMRTGEQTEVGLAELVGWLQERTGR